MTENSDRVAVPPKQKRTKKKRPMKNLKKRWKAKRLPMLPRFAPQGPMA